MPDLGDYLKSINKSKVNLMDEADPSTISEFPMWIVLQLLSYSQDTVLLLNELQLGVFDNKTAYEFLLYALPKKNRFARLIKADAINEDVEILMRYYNFNRQKAKDALVLLSPIQLKTIKQSLDEGGVVKV